MNRQMWMTFAAVGSEVTLGLTYQGQRVGLF